MEEWGIQQQLNRGTRDRNIDIWLAIKKAKKQRGIGQKLADQYGVSRQRIWELFHRIEKEMGGK
jgi:biotin operon repressor